MKYLKLFENSKIEETSDPRWSPFTKEMHKRFLDVCKPGEEDDFPMEEIKPFFKMLEEEYLEADDYEIYKVEQCWKRSGKVVDCYFLGLAKAHGPVEACLKLILHHQDPWMILDDEGVSAFMMEDDRYISSQIKKLEDKIKKWKTIY